MTRVARSADAFYAQSNDLQIVQGRKMSREVRSQLGRPRKPLISRRKTLEAALRIIDDEGLDALSIRRLGRELNVQGISLYHHFSNKEEILVGVCELALEKVRTPDQMHADWREWLLKNAKELRHALKSHPNLLPVLINSPPAQIGLAEQNASAGLLAVQGVPPEAIMPMLEGLGEIALGSVGYKSILDAPQTDSWKSQYPALYHLSKISRINDDALFDLKARALLSGLIQAFNIQIAETPATAPPEAARSLKPGRSAL